MATTTTSTPPAWKSGAAGYTAGVTGVVLNYPLDSMKVWMQCGSAGANRHLQGGAKKSQGRAINRVAATRTASMSTVAFSSTVVEPKLHLPKISGTIRALYSGVSVPLVTGGLVRSINFATYDTTRRFLSSDGSASSSLTHVAMAGAVSGNVGAILTAPFTLVKTHQQILGIGFRQAVSKSFITSSSSKLSNLYVAFGPHWLSATIGGACYYTTYEACKQSILQFKTEQSAASGKDHLVKLTIPERMASAAVTGIVNWSVIFPLDALKNRMYHQHIIVGGSNSSSKSVLSSAQMARQMIRERSVYRGFAVTVLRAGPMAALVLPIYDMAFQYLLDH
ncbi:Solute carrier family 25 [Seminavis robusta]|uniref:Solute carrier family 25 n=1 Tax=Seminavis robusta TaxID=568900 RepID=A0A9N8HYI6_9STRA|nr:Solute carrier family 25 [Seminavis robusta]|eukprot:Sro2868_g339030.1 Solute carrier family 25 (336) ;mRNA; r:2077-3084